MSKKKGWVKGNTVKSKFTNRGLKNLAAELGATYRGDTLDTTPDNPPAPQPPEVPHTAPKPEPTISRAPAPVSAAASPRVISRPPLVRQLPDPEPGHYAHAFGLYRPVEWNPSQLETMHRLMEGFIALSDERNFGLIPVNPEDMRVTLVGPRVMQILSLDSPKFAEQPTDQVQDELLTRMGMHSRAKDTVEATQPSLGSEDQRKQLRLFVEGARIKDEQGTFIHQAKKMTGVKPRRSIKAHILLGEMPRNESMSPHSEVETAFLATIQDSLQPSPTEALGRITLDKVEASPLWTPQEAQ